jgi:cytochrome c553
MIRTAILGLAVAALPTAALAQAAGDASRANVSMCAGCHGIPGYKTAYPSVFQVPMIAGQNPKYIEAALQAYRKGDRLHPSMRAIAGSLSDQQIADLAAYFGSK